VHRARNLYAKLPDRERDRIKHAYWQALDDAISEQDAKTRLQALVDQLAKEGFTAAARCLADDLDALVVHLRYPLRHRRRWRSTNLLERSLGEVKRRTKVMGRFPARRAVSPSSGRCSTCSSLTRPTASTSPHLIVNASNAPATKATIRASPRR
jgi:transposase-like protein